MSGTRRKMKTIEDLKTTEATFAGTGPTSLIYPKMLNSIAGMKWKVVQGYNTTAVAHLAMQRGEVDGATSSLNTLKTTQRDWLDQKPDPDHRRVRAQAQRRLRRRSGRGRIRPDAGGQGRAALLRRSGAVGRAVIAPPDLSADRDQRCCARPSTPP